MSNALGDSILCEDVYRIIASFLDHTTWRTGWIHACTFFNRMATKEEISRRTNHLEMLLLKYPYQQWDLEALMKGGKLSLEFVEEHPDLIFGLQQEGFHIADYMVWSPRITMEHVLKYKEHITKWRVLSYNKAITMEMIESHLELPWCWDTVSRNPNLTLDMVRKHSHKGFMLYWYESHCIYPQEIVDFCHGKIGFINLGNWLARNPNITPEYYMTFMKTYHRELDKNIKIDLYNSYLKGKLPLEFLQTYVRPETERKISAWAKLSEVCIESCLNQWDWDAMSGNPSLTEEIVAKYADRPWNLVQLSQLPIYPDLVNRFPDWPWFRTHLVWKKSTDLHRIKPDLLQSIFLQHFGLSTFWHYHAIERGLTWEKVVEYEKNGYILFSSLSDNPFIR